MKLTYRGNQIFILPLESGTKIFRPGESHSLTQEDFDSMNEKKKEHLESLKKTGDILLSDPVKKEAKVSIEKAIEEVEEKLPEPKEKKEEGDILEGNYKTVLKRLESVSDPEVLKGLLSREKRPSVLKVIKEKLGE